MVLRCVLHGVVLSSYDLTLVIESDCTFERASQPNPSEPVCSDIYNCRRSLSWISLTVFTLIFLYVRRTDSVVTFLLFLTGGSLGCLPRPKASGYLFFIHSIKYCYSFYFIPFIFYFPQCLYNM